MKKVLDKIYHMKFLNEIEITNLQNQDTFLEDKEWFIWIGFRDWRLKELIIKRNDYDFIIINLLTK